MSTATTKSNFVKFSHLHSRVLPIASPSSSLAFTRRLACLGRARAWSLSLSQYNGSVLLKPNTNTGRRRRDDIYCLASSPSAAAAVDKGEGIQITEIKEPNGRVRINVKVPPSICKESYEEVLTVLRKETQIPGFRRGEKIPDNVLINYVGKEKIKTAAIEAVLNRTLPEAMSSVKDRALKDSEHIETKFNALQAAFSPSSFLSYDVAVDLAPEVKWISPKAYKNLKVVVKVESDVAIEKAAEAELKSRHKDLGSLKIVQDRGTQIGDVVVLDISATRINEDGTDGDKLSFTEQKGFHLDTEETSHLVPGFRDSLLGLETGETRSFELTFPSTWKQKELQGVRARFTVECKEMFYRILPVLDDTLADKLITGCSTLDQVRETILKKHKEMEELRKIQATQQAVLQELSKVVKMDIPHSLLEEQGRNMYGAKLIQLQTTMKLTEEQIFTLSSAKAVNNYLLSQKEKIKEAVKQSLAIEEIFKLENLQYSEEELEKEVEKTVEEFKSYKHEFDRDRITEQAAEFLEGSQVLEWLMEQTDITYVTEDT
ncbi:hypothetical protein SUGI_0261380 [Cryptomeria japonica]|nr:hypothetical protein SUGI_0261380 [Cryptomeria japonica]